jgi:EPS-associated MarR family transcriptional regulator
MITLTSGAGPGGREANRAFTFDFIALPVSNAECVQRLNTKTLPEARRAGMLTDEYRYRILKLLEADPGASQRKLADQLGISLGRVNFCLQALIEKGLIKANNFRNNANKRVYLYLLTSKGIEEKARVTMRFLKSKLAEYEALKHELEELRREAEKNGAAQAQAERTE